MKTNELEITLYWQNNPAFTALNQQSETVKLSDFKGKKVVLYFYPKAMTPGCTTQACGITSAKDAFAAKNPAVFGMSPDTPERLVKFIEKHDLNFDLLSDEDHSIADKYGVWALKKFMGREYDGIHRLTFIIDEEGKLEHIMEKVKTKTHHDDVLALL
ncbi:thioredoxin-dependent thiol peroxidase [Marinicellulosiphila megalodicopiae]|uniref:thioredoxin-dependent thiol peroxidase n=1 Tax=Marinicellulosiphila megalodicopiae TaxID=2724896 RepID=UPI003BAF5614